MSATPRFKVFDKAGVYQASVHEVEAAAALLGALYQGGTVRVGHAKRDIVYEDGKDGDAGSSYDAVALHVYGRLDEWQAALEAKRATQKPIVLGVFA